ncbi:MAG: hypothetical protein Ct9H300mP21_08260 [Pseudomonadota bacterium]|nr:MAG: hypothetical protein Ct9H300mP21_08260 [Pseudomonadota bacterium]
MEKDIVTGEINYEPENHEKMVLLRDEKIRRIVKDLPPLELIGPEKNELLVVTWGSVFGPGIFRYLSSNRRIPVSMSSQN